MLVETSVGDVRAWRAVEGVQLVHQTNGHEEKRVRIFENVYRRPDDGIIMGTPRPAPADER